MNRQDDVKFGMEWQEFLCIATSYGFKKGMLQKFEGILGEEKFDEEEIIFFLEEKGLILHAESFEGKLGSATVYGEILAHNREDLDVLECQIGTENLLDNGDTISFSLDVRYGIYSQLDAISKYLMLNEVWKSTPPDFISFYNYMEDKSNPQIMSRKINACTPEVKKIIFGE